MRLSKVTFLLPGYTLDSPFSAGASDCDGDVDAFACRSAFRFTDGEHQEPWQSQMASVLEFDTASGKKMPTAKLASVADNPSANLHLVHGDGLVRADPVFLKADKDSARLIPSEQLQLSEEEADALLQVLNDFVRQDGLEFFRRNSDEWYMTGMDANALESFPPTFLANRNASTFMPEGETMANWRRLLTELQMLLHTHPVNQHRETKGLMPVNSVWFWGGANLPAPPGTSLSVEVFADNRQAVDMCRYRGVTVKPLLALNDLATHQFTADHAVILDTRLVNAWLDADAAQLDDILQNINRHWLTPCVDRMRSRTIAKIVIGTEDGLHGICDPQTAANSTGTNKAGQWKARLMRLFSR